MTLGRRTLAFLGYYFQAYHLYIVKQEVYNKGRKSIAGCACHYVGSEKVDMGNLEPLQDLWTLYSLVKQVFETAKAVRSGIQWLQSDTVKNTVATVRVTARSMVFPTIIERLDDGTNPEQLHLRIDMALAFPQERIDTALYYRDSQSKANLAKQFWTAIAEQAFRDAQPGDERNINVTLDYMDNAAIYTYSMHGQVGGDWSYIRPPQRELRLGRFWRKAREIQAQYLLQHDAKHSVASKQ